MQKCVSDYLDCVCAAIHGKALRSAARAELIVHMAERCEELVGCGMDEETAALSAVARMGDPSELGRRIADANRPKGKIASLIGGAVLLTTGILYAVYSTGGNLANVFDMSAAVIVLFLASAYALLSCGGKFTALRFLRGLKVGALYAGAISMVIGIILVLTNLTDLSALGPGLSLTLISVLYGVLLSAAAGVIESRIKPPESVDLTGLIV